MKLVKPQQSQEDLYEFPYHYTVQFTKDFTFSHHWDWGLNYASTVEFLQQKIREDSEAQSIADIGCGDGRLTREMFLQFPKTRLLGFDYSERSILLARGMNSDLGIEFRCADIIQEDIGEQFDVATLMEVYEHIDPTLSDQFLQGISRLLSDNGVLHLTVPHANMPLAHHHFRHFTIADLTAELESHFEILEVMPFEKQSWKRKWLLRLFINRWFALNHKGLKNALYRYYKRNLFYTKNESDCQRLYIKCRKLSG